MGNGIAAALGSKLRQHSFEPPEIPHLAADVGDVAMAMPVQIRPATYATARATPQIVSARRTTVALGAVSA